MTIELKTYDLQILELVVIMRCMQDHPNVKVTDLAKILNVGKSTLYRKIEALKDPATHAKFIDIGYTLSFVKTMQIDSIS